MRMLAGAPLFSLWTDTKRELEWAADEIDRLRRRVAELEASDERRR
jgi:polyhydroxyalkanoate synthesis regulator phasin